MIKTTLRLYLILHCITSLLINENSYTPSITKIADPILEIPRFRQLGLIILISYRNKRLLISKTTLNKRITIHKYTLYKGCSN